MFLFFFLFVCVCLSVCVQAPAICLCVYVWVILVSCHHCLLLLWTTETAQPLPCVSVFSSGQRLGRHRQVTGLDRTSQNAIFSPTSRVPSVSTTHFHTCSSMNRWTIIQRRGEKKTRKKKQTYLPIL